MGGFQFARRKFQILAGLGLVAWLSSAAALNPVANFDLNRYLGTWYEIAAIRGFLQSKCARDTRLDFTAAENGAVARHSYCVRDDGMSEANEGRSRSLDPALPSVQKTTSVYFLGIWWRILSPQVGAIMGLGCRIVDVLDQ